MDGELHCRCAPRSPKNRGSRAEVLDLVAVVPIARKHINEAGLADRVTTGVGDLTVDEFG